MGKRTEALLLLAALICAFLAFGAAGCAIDSTECDAAISAAVGAYNG